MRVATACLAFLPAPLLVAQATWSQVTVPGPSARRGAFAVYDSQRQVVVLFGGITWPVVRNYETWEWDGASWTLRVPNLGFETYEGAAAYDSGRGRVVFLTTYGWTYEYDGTTWQQRSTQGPRAARATMAHDAMRARTVLFTPSSETWEWDGTNWRQRNSGGPPPRFWSAMVYHPLRQECLLFGGLESVPQTVAFDDLWAWNGSYWREVQQLGARPPARSLHAMVYDAARDRLVVYGGSTEPVRPSRLFDTWEWDGAAWTAIPTASAPPASVFCAMAYDAARNATVHFGGSVDINGNVGYSGQTSLFVPRVSGVAGYQPFGAGCAGPSGVPMLQNVGGSRPVMGATLQLQLVNLPPSSLAVPFGITGFSNTTWNGQPLPVPLHALGMPGCAAWIAPAATDVLANQSGVANWSIPIPALPNLTGQRFYVQGAVLAPGSNAAGIVVSNAGSAEVGAQ